MKQLVGGSFEKQLVWGLKREVEERFISLLQTCRDLKQIKQIQNQIISYGFEQNEFIALKFAAVCCESKNVVYARKVFDRITEPNALLWNAVMKGYSDNELYREAVVMFSDMRKKDVRPNCFTFPIVLKSCRKISAWTEGKEVHCFVVKSGFVENHFIGTMLIEIYSDGGESRSAYRVFNEMPVRNVVAWTAIISGYILNGDIESARRLFDVSVERDVVLWNIMVSGYISEGDMERARKLFDEMPRKDVMSWNTMLTGYFSNDHAEAGERLFEEIPQKNVFSWNGILAGYANKGRFSEVLGTFKRMLNESAVQPTDAMLVTVLSACAREGALDLGKWIHVYAENNGLMGSISFGNGLVDMYAKCGSIDSAIDVFNGMVSKDLITWNAMINGLATHGRGSDALEVFVQMKKVGEIPDGITFIGVLSACSHMGMVEKGLSYFNSMTEDYSIVPEIKHYGCIVDLLARAGMLNEAVNFVCDMPIEADEVIWSSLLGACRTYDNVQLAELAFEWLVKLEPKNPANFVMLSNIYGFTKRWDDLARFKGLTRESRKTSIRKPAGCSMIGENGCITESV